MPIFDNSIYKMAKSMATYFSVPAPGFESSYLDPKLIMLPLSYPLLSTFSLLFVHLFSTHLTLCVFVYLSLLFQRHDLSHYDVSFPDLRNFARIKTLFNFHIIIGRPNYSKKPSLTRKINWCILLKVALIKFCHDDC